jgi:hypothetical protein
MECDEAPEKHTTTVIDRGKCGSPLLKNLDLFIYSTK